MAGTRTKKETVSTSTRQVRTVQDENQEPIVTQTPVKKKAKMTRQEKLAARERARLSMMKKTTQSTVTHEVITPSSAKEDLVIESKAAAAILDDCDDNSENETPNKIEEKFIFKLANKKACAVIQSPQMKCPRPEPKKKLVGIPELVMVGMQSEDAEEVERAIWNLANSILPRNDALKENVKEANLLGMGCLLVLTMNKWKNNSTIQHLACQCIRTYAFASTIGKVTLLKTGAVESILVAMNKFHFPGFKIEACRALLSLSYPCEEPSSSTHQPMPFGSPRKTARSPPLLDLEYLCQSWQSFVFHYDGLEEIFRCLQLLEETPDSLADCATLLSNLLSMNKGSNVDQVRCRIRKVGAQSLVFLAMQKHYQHERLCQEGRLLTSQFT